MPYRSPSPNDSDLAIFRGWFTLAFACAGAGIALLAYADTTFWGIVRALAGAALLATAWLAARHALENP